MKFKYSLIELYDKDHNLIPIIRYPWICELWLSMHRKYDKNFQNNILFYKRILFRTSLLRRLLNYFNRSRKRSLKKLVDEFVRVHGGYFSHPIGSRVSQILLINKQRI